MTTLSLIIPSTHLPLPLTHPKEIEYHLSLLPQESGKYPQPQTPSLTKPQPKKTMPQPQSLRSSRKGVEAKSMDGKSDNRKVIKAGAINFCDPFSGTSQKPQGESSMLVIRTIAKVQARKEEMVGVLVDPKNRTPCPQTQK
ncbi:MAG: hypothetical protein LQ352_001385 [Teloschistes flavicans]|nr:MAG: hypothetical protein LQ352_001385 [Teloschistes flavicans]